MHSLTKGGGSGEGRSGRIVFRPELVGLNSTVKKTRNHPTDRPTDRLKYNVDLFATKKGSNSYQCPCPTFATDPVMYTNLFIENIAKKLIELN